MIRPCRARVRAEPYLELAAKRRAADRKGDSALRTNPVDVTRGRRQMIRRIAMVVTLAIGAASLPPNMARTASASASTSASCNKARAQLAAAEAEYYENPSEYGTASERAAAKIGPRHAYASLQTLIDAKLVPLSTNQMYQVILAKYGLRYKLAPWSNGPCATPASSKRTAPKTGVTGLALGGDYSCAVTDGTAAQCWGYTTLGGPHIGSQEQHVAARLAGVTNVAQLAIGDTHVCALLPNKSVDCWGGNDLGQLGDGTATNRLTAAPVPGLSNVAQISAGQDHTCALLSDSTVHCWGDNRQGQLGTGPVPGSQVPQLVSGLSGVKAIAAGGQRSCALLDAGSVECWGSDELGDGTTDGHATPVEVSDLSGATAITVGRQHACAILTDKSVVCWGHGSNGALGTASLQDALVPTKVVGVSNATALAAGGGHTCALLSDGVVECWGDNSAGQLGDGTNESRPHADTVDASPGGKESFLTEVTAIAAGNLHTCALLEDKTVVCWGDNNVGQLGDNTTTQRTDPVPVRGLS